MSAMIEGRIAGAKKYVVGLSATIRL